VELRNLKQNLKLNELNKEVLRRLDKHLDILIQYCQEELCAKRVLPIVNS
jgi:hypothetical protein